MTPVLSLVIPCRNATSTLPRILDSVMAQSLRSLEVILVDDASDVAPCAPVAEAYRNKGLDITLVVSQERLYTKNARLLGVEHAKGDIIHFADADDVLWGTDNLERNVSLFKKTGVDLLQFRCVQLDEDGRFVGVNHNTPLAKRLYGNDIFLAYLKGSLFGIWAHLYSRRVWQELMPFVRPFPVWHQLEDLCLLLFYYSRANSYAGSDCIGYGYIRDASHHRSPIATVGKTIGYHSIFTHFPIFLREQGKEEDVIQELIERLRKALRVHAGRASQAWAASPNSLNLLNETEIESLLLAVADSLAENGRKLRSIHHLIFS